VTLTTPSTMTEPLLISTAIMIGLLGSTHCIGMCGGIAASIGLQRHRSTLSNASFLMSYNLGRISSYAIAGALLGSVGALVATGTSGLILRSFAGFMLIAMGLYVGQWWLGITHLEKVGGKLWKLIGPSASRLMPVKTLPQALLLGVAWGWLPCGLVYSTLLWSSSAGSWQQGALLMAGFGLGTLPAMFTTGLLAQQVKALLQQKWTRKLSALVIIAFGIFTLPLSELISISH